MDKVIQHNYLEKLRYIWSAKRVLAMAIKGSTFGIVIPYTSLVSISSGFNPSDGVQSKQWNNRAKAIKTKVTPSGAPGHFLFPALKGSILKSIPWLISTRLPSLSQCLSGRKSFTLSQILVFRPNPCVLMKTRVLAGM